MARLMRLDKEIESIKEDQERMVQKEIKNIQELEVEEATTIESNVSLNAFDGLELPTGQDEWLSGSSSGNVVESQGN